tara:strand:- start:2008 stop:2370 length:363 start_codon:yes stop_codon:yes gene_type:complete
VNIEDELQNWFLYLKNLPKPGPHPDSTCRSIEHRYEPEAGETFEEEPKEQEFYDIQQAERMEELVCKLPEKFKKIIVFRYVKFRWLADYHLAKKLKVSKYEFKRDLFVAKQMLKRLLDGI